MCEDTDRQWERYGDIKWLMQIIDLRTCLERLGIRMTNVSGEEWEGYCPDHFIYRGVEPSDPKWYLEVSSGKTFCQTEGRGSNLLFTCARLLKKDGKFLKPEDCENSIRFLVGRDCSESEIALFKSRNEIKSLKDKNKERTTVKKTWENDILFGIENGYLSSKCKDFFIQPPDKPRTNIREETLRHFKVFEKTNGTYTNRAVIPIFQNHGLQGFVAVDIIGKKKWLMNHPTLTEKDYKKTLYPSTESGFFKKEVLFGYDECEKNADYIIITEGAREVMKLWQEGFRNSVAILGAYLSDEQFMLLTKLAPKRLVLMFDGDKAGRNISKQVKEKTEELFNVQVVQLPEGIDPKQYCQKQIENAILID